MSKPGKIKLKELEWNTGYSEDQTKTCIYANGHVDKAAFLEAVQACDWMDVPKDAREALTLENIEHCMFRRMSPSEARAKGYDSGMMKDPDGSLKITMVEA